MTATFPAHGPGCRPLAGSSSARFRTEPRYVCTANCPRRNALAREYDAARRAPQPLVLVTFKDEGARVGPVVLTPNDAVRLAQRLLVAVDAQGIQANLEFQNAKAVERYVRKAINALKGLSLS